MSLRTRTTSTRTSGCWSTSTAPPCGSKTQGTCSLSIFIFDLVSGDSQTRSSQPKKLVAKFIFLKAKFDIVSISSAAKPLFRWWVIDAFNVEPLNIYSMFRKVVDAFNVEPLNIYSMFRKVVDAFNVDPLYIYLMFRRVIDAFNVDPLYIWTITPDPGIRKDTPRFPCLTPG